MDDSTPITVGRMVDIAWLAGLLEGEGCFFHGPGGRILIRLAMTDRDVVERASQIMEGVFEKPQEPRGSRRKTVYSMRVRGDAIEWMKILRPFMCLRRQNKIDECLAFAKSRPGKRWNSAGGTSKPGRGSKKGLALVS